MEFMRYAKTLYSIISYYPNCLFYLWVLHPVAHLSNWFLMIPSIATKFQYVNSPFFIFLHSLHVSAPTGHPQVRYTIRCFQGLFLLQRIRCTYINCHHGCLQKVSLQRSLWIRVTIVQTSNMNIKTLYIYINGVVGMELCRYWWSLVCCRPSGSLDVRYWLVLVQHTVFLVITRLLPSVRFVRC
jgi:hypothetical protein